MPACKDYKDTIRVMPKLKLFMCSAVIFSREKVEQQQDTILFLSFDYHPLSYAVTSIYELVVIYTIIRSIFPLIYTIECHCPSVTKKTTLARRKSQSDIKLHLHAFKYSKSKFSFISPQTIFIYVLIAKYNGRKLYIIRSMPDIFSRYPHHRLQAWFV